VDAMKTEINLRTREFTIAREFYWPRLLVTLAAIGLVVIIVGGSVFVYLYQMQLSVENRNLAQEQASLQQQVAPLEELEARLKELEKRAAIVEGFEEEIQPWSANFQLILNLALDNGLEATHLSASPEGEVLIKGRNGSMRQVALFVQDLAREMEGNIAVHRSMGYRQNEGFKFEVELTTNVAGGGEQ
jgi:Tfp pilus assembly protein PilN